MDVPSPPSSSSGDVSEGFADLLEAELEALEKKSGDEAEVGEMTDERDRKGKAKLEEYEVSSPEASIDRSTAVHAEVIGEVSTGGKRKREIDEAGPSGRPVEDSMAEEKVSGGGATCPPHPGFMWGICVRCGQHRRENDAQPRGLALRYIHETMEVSEHEAARMRQEELRKVLNAKKLFLVLDLDHTLLNSTLMTDISETEYRYLSGAYHLQELSPVPGIGPRIVRAQPGTPPSPSTTSPTERSSLASPEPQSKSAAIAEPAEPDLAAEVKLEAGTEPAEAEGEVEEDEMEVEYRRPVVQLTAEEEMLLTTETLLEDEDEEEGRDENSFGGVRKEEREESGLGAPWRKDALYRLPHLQMITKLRPYVHEFLEKASEMFEMYVYTMGERIYANAMAEVLDPTGKLFGNRVISSRDSTRRHSKDLDIVLGAESAVLILDDTEAVWPKHGANLIVMERYHFFRASRRQFYLGGASLIEQHRDECEEEGTLNAILRVLRDIHKTAFSAPSAQGSEPEVPDVRELLVEERKKVLAGCRLVFSRLEHSRLRQMAEAMGAVCNTAVDDRTTHVVTIDRTSDKSKWATRNRRHVVLPEWIDHAHYLWRRGDEAEYAVPEIENPVPGAQYATTAERPEVNLLDGNMFTGSESEQGDENSPRSVNERVETPRGGGKDLFLEPRPRQPRSTAAAERGESDSSKRPEARGGGEEGKDGS